MKILLYGENWEGTHVDCISKALDKRLFPYDPPVDFFATNVGSVGVEL